MNGLQHDSEQQGLQPADGSNSGTSSSRKCWSTARERNRMKARFAIRQRVLQTTTTPASTDDASDLCGRDCTLKTVHISDSVRCLKIPEIINRIIRGDTSYFSIQFMEENYPLLNEPFPSKLLLQKATMEDQECVAALLDSQRLQSRLGQDGLAQLKAYVVDLESCTILEFAVWLKRYRIVRQFILGGVNPIVRGTYSRRRILDTDARIEQIKSVGSMVLKRFFSGFVPLSLSCYILCRVIGLRQVAWEHRQLIDKSSTPQLHYECEICAQAIDPYLLLFISPNTNGVGRPCRHQFCELCLWKDVLQYMNYRDCDVVLCPVCCSGNSIDIGLILEHSNGLCMDTSRLRYEESLERYNTLPSDSVAIKQLTTKKKLIPECDTICFTWSDAVKPSLGLTQTARRDKFFLFAEKGSYHYVKGCLDSGIDVNVQNEYGQTALHIAIWRNDVPLVQLLLKYGSDPLLAANGRITCWNAATVHRQPEILELLRVACADNLEGNTTSSVLNCQSGNVVRTSLPSFITLIDWSSDHPGAGSFVLDDFLVDAFIDSLIDLWMSLPIETSTKSKIGPCSVRSYYCDVNGTITAPLCSALTKATINFDLPFDITSCGPQMRFLNYAEQGATLAPHIDLNRLDPRTEKRSTHSFLLYLTTCENGGETSLIGDVAGDGRDVILASIRPKRGRLLVFPHRCPHEGLSVIDIPKILIRGELWLRTLSGYESTISTEPVQCQAEKR